MNPAGQFIAICSPRAKKQPQGYCWADITMVQYDEMEKYDIAIVAFRLEGRLLVVADWNTLKTYFTGEAMQYNKSEGNHWQLHIFEDYIEIVNNPRTCPVVEKDYRLFALTPRDPQ
jgi:hypothetical protein